MADMRSRLQRAAAEAKTPEDRAWAASRYQELYGEAPYTGAGPRRDQYVPLSMDPMMKAIDKRNEEKANRPKRGVGETMLLHGGQGASFGLTDELSGATYAALDMGPPMAQLPGAAGLVGRGLHGLRRMFDPHDSVPIQGPGDAYRYGRDVAREELDETAADRPNVALGSQVAGSLLNPIKAPIPRGTTAWGRIASAAGQGAVQGAAQGLGTSRADLTEGDVVGALKDTLPAAGLGAGLGVAGGTVSEGVRAGGKYIADNLKNRVLNEIGEGVSGKQVTPTQRKILNRSQDAIWEEMTTGPDAKTVRGVRYGKATEGRAALAPVMNRIGEEISAEYDKFAAAGRGQFPAAPFLARLEQEAVQALEEGDSLVADGIRAYAGRVAKAAEEKNGMLGLKQVRGLTTEAQEIAKSAIDGLKGGANAQKLRAVAATAGETMDDQLGLMAQGDEALEASANVVRGKNRRYAANKRIDEMLEMREPKENTAPGMLVQGVKGAFNPITLGLGGAAFSDDDSRIENALTLAGLGIAGRSALPAARLAQRGITSAGIRTQLPGYSGPSAAAVARSVRPFVPPLSLSLLDMYRSRQQENK